MPLLRFVLIIGFAILLLAAGVASARERADGPPQQQQMQQDRPLRPMRRAGVPRPLRVHQIPHPPGSAGDHEMAPGRRNFEGVPPGSPRMGGQPGEMPPQRSGNLTPDERKALRQQIDAASRDVYRPAGVGAPRP